MWVTILTPLFNGIEYFDECYNSIIGQTNTSWKWIIGINGHEDDVIFNSLLDKISDPRILIKKYSTKGKVNTLNEIIKEVTTQYIALCDCDDIWFPNKLEIQHMLLEENKNIDVLGTGLQYIGELQHVPDLPNGVIDLEILLNVNPMVNSSVVMKKELGLWNDRFFGLDDYDLWFRLLIDGKKIVTIPTPLIYHRIYRESNFNFS